MDDNEQSNYHCSPEWHLQRLRHANDKRVPFAAILYPFAHRISKNSGLFHGSAVGVASHFGVSEWTVLRAMEALVAAGFFVVVSKEAFQSSVYRVFSHSDWVKDHPNCCVVKATFPWSGEDGDKLAGRLYNASGGKVKYLSFQLAALRKTGLSDDEIVHRFEGFVADENRRRQAGGWHGHWKSVRYRFLQYLKGNIPKQELEQLEPVPT